MAKDPLIGRRAVINEDATTLKGGHPHPQRGQEGEILGRTAGGKQYQLLCGEVLVNLPLTDFTVQGGNSDSTGPAADSTLLLTKIVRSRTNRHVLEDDELLNMAATMKLYGVLQPLLVRRLPAERLQETFEDADTRHATHEIIAGERRFAAARIAGLRRVPVLIIEADNSTAVVMQLIENLHRQDLNPLDEAHGIQLLIDNFGMTRDAVADSLKKGRTHIFESLRLLNICPEAISAIKAGTLNRSLALLVAQRPTPALQVEFLKKVLTGGPDGGPLSHRSAKELAQRHYMTDLTKAPFALDDAKLLPKIGACLQCPKRTGANPELWDKAGSDVCTDTACFADKKEAHYERLKADAQTKGRKVITGREAREIMPTENATPTGYMLLDKPKKGETAPLRQVLGQDVPQSKVVLIETPSGGIVEAVPTRAAGEAMQAKGAATKIAAKPQGPTKEELEEAYQLRWRSAAVRATIEGLRVEADPDELDGLPEEAAYRVILTMARETHDEALAQIFQLRPGFDDDTLQSAVRNSSQASTRVQHMVMLMLAAAFDHGPLYGRPVDEALHLEAVAPIAKVDLGTIKKDVQQEMNAEAVERAAEAQADVPSADKAKPALKTKGKAAQVTVKPGKTEVMMGIAQALQQAETPNGFAEGQAVKLKADVKGPSGGLIRCKDRVATIVRASGRKWVVSLPDPWPFPGTDAKPMELTVDYTELEVDHG